ncbi:MAG: hypothetical protein JSV18_02320 [Candidatus Bathyarchaeota archaeon]|nr:MAG: hypothetical protein JSV18_02320 [Candidatus Bathyarchaeota archaeon]
MKSYIKIYGPPILKAVKALEKIAIDMPEVCIMDHNIAQRLQEFDSVEGVETFFSGMGELDTERCNTIISRSGEELGENDFFFEWFADPTIEQLNDLIGRIDTALAKVGVKYTITTK